MTASVKELGALRDPLSSAGPEMSCRKIYPGLLVHVILIPTDPFRNQFVLQPSSEYVAQKMVKLVQESEESAINKLLKDLIKIPKARGFAGSIWEPLFSKNIKSTTGTWRIYGSKLPIQNSTDDMSALFQASSECIVVDEFKNWGDFRRTVGKWIQNINRLSSSALLVKAKDDNFVTIDVILVFTKDANNSDKKELVVAGQQMTVAENTHELKEVGARAFSNAVEWIRSEFRHRFSSVRKEIWFLQPEACLVTFGFSKLQPLRWEEPRQSLEKDAGTSMLGRKRMKTQRLGDFARGAVRKQSTDSSYWHESLQDLQQPNLALSRAQLSF